MRALRLAVLFAGMFVATSLLADKVAATTQGRSIAGFLNADGSLKLPENFSGSLDPAGFRMVQQLGAAPKFVPEKQTSAAKLFGVPGGCNAENNR